MSIVQAIPNKSVMSDQLLDSFGEKIYLWKNLVTDKRKSTNWVNRIYKDSIFHDLWMIFTMPLN